MNSLTTQTKPFQSALRPALLAALRQKWDAVAKLRTIAYVEHGAWPDAKHPVAFAQMPAKLDARLEKVGTNNTWVVSQYKQYLEVKPREAQWRTEAGSFGDIARRIAQTKPHRFEIKPKSD